MKHGKKYGEAAKLVDRTTQYDPADAIALVKKTATAKFDETVEVHIRTGCDGRHAEQQIRGAVVLPNGTGKTVKVLVFAKGAKLDEAQAAGADYVGGDELIPRIQNEGWLDFDVVVATPDMMGVVGRLGKILGPKGLMPNPKAGTVTMDVTKAINDIKAGKIEYRLDKSNIVHVPIGKVSFTEEALSENYRALMDAIMKAKPSALKGQYHYAGYHHGPRRESFHRKILLIADWQGQKNHMGSAVLSRLKTPDIQKGDGFCAKPSPFCRSSGTGNKFPPHPLT